MPIYYRADSRPPEEIFRDGFKPIFYSEHLVDYSIPKWWQRGIRFNYDEISVSEAENSKVVCMTTRFESAPIFPVDNTTSMYVYCIELPEDNVFNFYDYQLKEARQYLPEIVNSGVVAVGLCGYEAFTMAVKPENIIGVVKCERSELKPLTAGTQVYDCQYRFMVPFDRKFRPDSTLMLNSNFKDLNSSFAKEAVENIKTKLNIEENTTSIESAILEAGLPKPTTKSLFKVHLSKGNIIEASKSIFFTLYHLLKYVFKCLPFIKKYENKKTLSPEVIYRNGTCIEPDRDILSSSPVVQHARPLHAVDYARDNSFSGGFAQNQDSPIKKTRATSRVVYGSR